MNRKRAFYVAGVVAVAALGLAGFLGPQRPLAFTLPEAAGPPVAISAAGDGAWAIVGNKVYYLSLKPRGDLRDRIISLIDDEELK